MNPYKTLEAVAILLAFLENCELSHDQIQTVLVVALTTVEQCNMTQSDIVCNPNPDMEE